MDGRALLDRVPTGTALSYFTMSSVTSSYTIHDEKKKDGVEALLSLNQIAEVNQDIYMQDLKLQGSFKIQIVPQQQVVRAMKSYSSF